VSQGLAGIVEPPIRDYTAATLISFLRRARGFTISTRLAMAIAEAREAIFANSTKRKKKARISKASQLCRSVVIGTLPRNIEQSGNPIVLLGIDSFLP
jgi:hypothetical protein